MLFYGFQINPNNVPFNRAGLYRITCLITNKIYIGVSFDIAKRAKSHSSIGRSSPRKLRHALLTYGKSNFLFEPLAYSINNSTDWLLLVEAEWINVFDTIENGYNVQQSSGAVGPYGPAHGDAIRHALANISDEARERRAITLRKNGKLASSRKTKEERIADGHRLHSTLTKENLIEGGKKGGTASAAKKTKEQLLLFQIAGQRARLLLSPEQRLEYSRRAGLASAAVLSPQQRSERAHQAGAASKAKMTTEQRREAGIKGAMRRWHPDKI